MIGVERLNLVTWELENDKILIKFIIKRSIVCLWFEIDQISAARSSTECLFGKWVKVGRDVEVRLVEVEESW